MTECFAGAPGHGEAGMLHPPGLARGLDVDAGGGHGPCDDFGRLVRLVRENERLLKELDAVRAQARRAWGYLAEPGANATLALAQLDRLRMRRSALLAHLRANRVEARDLLGGNALASPGDDRIELN